MLSYILTLGLWLLLPLCNSCGPFVVHIVWLNRSKFFFTVFFQGLQIMTRGQNHAQLWIVVDQIGSDSEQLCEVFAGEDINSHNGWLWPPSWIPEYFFPLRPLCQQELRLTLKGVWLDHRKLSYRQQPSWAPNFPLNFGGQLCSWIILKKKSLQTFI